MYQYKMITEILTVFTYFRNRFQLFTMIMTKAYDFIGLLINCIN